MCVLWYYSEKSFLFLPTQDAKLPETLTQDLFWWLHISKCARSLFGKD